MRLSGYTNPLRSFERKLASDYPSREFRNPGLRSMRSTTSGLGSLKRTMPHLMPKLHLQTGGTFDPVGQAYAAARPNLYNPDPFARRIQALQRGMSSFRNPSLSAFPGSTYSLPYAEGGPSPDDMDPEELQEPSEDLAPEEQNDKEILVEAMLALEGQHPDPDEALQAFVETFGPGALRDLESIVKGREQAKKGSEDEEEEEGEPDEELPEQPEEQGDEEEDQLAGAGGGLLRGPGTGQSDEIEAETPAGRPVLLSDGEYVFDAPTVAALGDGSTHAGARRLDELRKKIRSDAYGHSRQAKPMKRGGKSILAMLNA